MCEEQFTAQAAVLWGTIPREARERLLKNVFCAECRGSVEIIKFTCEERDGNLVIKGSCAKCGNEVVRVVETSQADSSGNQREPSFENGLHPPNARLASLGETAFPNPHNYLDTGPSLL
jgi:hypothetical protein